MLLLRDVLYQLQKIEQQLNLLWLIPDSLPEFHFLSFQKHTSLIHHKQICEVLGIIFFIFFK